MCGYLSQSVGTTLADCYRIETCTRLGHLLPLKTLCSNVQKGCSPLIAKFYLIHRFSYVHQDLSNGNITMQRVALKGVAEPKQHTPDPPMSRHWKPASIPQTSVVIAFRLTQGTKNTRSGRSKGSAIPCWPRPVMGRLRRASCRALT